MLNAYRISTTCILAGKVSVSVAYCGSTPDLASLPFEQWNGIDLANVASLHTSNVDPVSPANKPVLLISLLAITFRSLRPEITSVRCCVVLRIQALTHSHHAFIFRIRPSYTVGKASESEVIPTGFLRPGSGLVTLILLSCI